MTIDPYHFVRKNLRSKQSVDALCHRVLPPILEEAERMFGRRVQPYPYQFAGITFNESERPRIFFPPPKVIHRKSQSHSRSERDATRRGRYGSSFMSAFICCLPNLDQLRSLKKARLLGSSGTGLRNVPSSSRDGQAGPIMVSSRRITSSTTRPRR
jgi:hypothetical protein